MTLIINEKIQSRYVKLIDADEKLVGIVAKTDAIARARQAKLDLVLITEGENPICKLLDADSYRYELAKKEKAAAKRQRELAVETKEIQLRPVTDQNDINVKVKSAKRFLDNGDKVRVICKMKGREKSHKSIGFEAINKFLENLGDHKVDKALSDSGNDISIILAPMVTKSELVKQKEEAK